jgi:fructose-1,6-bisphosphatase/inositol monophosphatase family enzyme
MFLESGHSISAFDIEERIKIVAREIVMPAWRDKSAIKVDTKAHANDFVTNIDHAAEKALTERLTGMLPGSVVFGEETSHGKEFWDVVRNNHHVWVVDPIDGTRAFKDGHEDFAMMATLMEDGKPALSCIHYPAHHCSLICDGDEAVYFNDERKGISEVEYRKSYRGVEDNPLDLYVDHALSAHIPKLKKAARALGYDLSFHTGGAIAMCYLNLFHNPYGPRPTQDRGLAVLSTKPWDHIHGMLMANMAGGSMTDFHDKPFKIADFKGGLIVAPARGDCQRIATVLNRALSI